MFKLGRRAAVLFILTGASAAVAQPPDPSLSDVKATPPAAPARF